MGKKAIFLDRDGVLIEDIGLLTSISQIRLADYAVEALRNLAGKEYLLIVVSNQPVIARGLATPKDVEQINQHLGNLFLEQGGRRIDAFYYCPHHPNADLTEYRINCQCRKPKAGMLLAAATAFDIELHASHMVGDRISDIIAGQSVGCSTYLLTTGKHLDPPIVSDAIDLSIKPDHVCTSLLSAVKLILEK